jgi:hypothetical protein
MAKTHIDWLELTNNSANPTDVDTTRGGLAVVNDTLMKYVSGAWAEVEAGIGKDTTDILTNKTFDCDGTGNVLSNVNAAELDSIGDAAFGIPFVIQKSVSNLTAAGTNIITTHPKMRVLDVWFVHTSADSGTLSVNLGQTGSLGDAITDTITIAAGDKDITRAAELDDAKWDVDADAGLVAVGDGGDSVDGVVFVLCMRID